MLVVIYSSSGVRFLDISMRRMKVFRYFNEKNEGLLDWPPKSKIMHKDYGTDFLKRGQI
jgi:hypothetical protein